MASYRAADNVFREFMAQKGLCWMIRARREFDRGSREDGRRQTCYYRSGPIIHAMSGMASALSICQAMET